LVTLYCGRPFTDMTPGWRGAQTEARMGMSPRRGDVTIAG